MKLRFASSLVSIPGAQWFAIYSPLLQEKYVRDRESYRVEVPGYDYKAREEA